MTKKGDKTGRALTIERINPSFHIEADGAAGYTSLLIVGVIGVRELSSEEITVATRREGLKITGKELKITVFESKTIEISGKIDNFIILSKRGRR